MKKSFKKAGAAVLSMSMLLAMGAVSMPVFATNDLHPGQIEIDLTSASKHADDDGHTYEYLDGVNTGTVKMYQVATLGDDGWSWKAPFDGIEALTFLQAFTQNVNGDISTQTGLDYSSLDLTTFEDLLKKIKPTNSANEVPDATSEEMLAVASALARIANGRTADFEADLDNGETLLPADASLWEGLTKNTIGYYLIVTDTDQADVTVQPSLVVLKNGDSTVNPKKISLKGKRIAVDKSIKKVADATIDHSTGGAVISESGNTAIVAANDLVTYEINTQLPKYDALMPAEVIAAMKPFVIKDTPTSGIQIADYNNGTYDFTNADIKVYISNTKRTGNYDLETLSSTAGSGVKKLTPDVDYTLAELSDAESRLAAGVVDGRGFTVTIEGTTLKDETKGALANASANPVVKDTMENEYVYVTFKAKITDELNRTYQDVDPLLTAGDITATDIDGDTNLSAIGLTAVPTNGADEAETLAAWQDALTTNAVLSAALGLNEDSTAEAIKTAVNTYKATMTDASFSDLDDITKFAAVARAIAYLNKENADITAANAGKIDANGNKNTATLDFGNDFATGQGDGNSEDTVKVFSVDLDLVKKVKKELIVSNGTNQPGVAGGYEDSIEYEPVKGAVFKLVKIDEDSNGNGAEVLVSYAVTDENGDLKVITPSAATVAPAGSTIKSDEEVEFKDNTANDPTAVQTYHMTTYTKTATSTDYVPDAWIELTRGQYKIYEVFAPAGYKSWPSAGISFTVVPGTDSAASPEYTGEFSATGGSADQFVDQRTEEEKALTGDDAVAPYYIKFDGDTGELDGTILNQYDDKLPATGGIGTVLFTAGGISIVLIAGALFVMYMKKRNAEDEE